MSYYLKYRPRRVGELDLEATRKALEGVLKSGKYAHAYLLAGPKGTGKTSSARILAKILNCEGNKQQVTSDKKQELQEPCLECEQCRAIGAGNSVAVIEIDAASNRGIDDIRTLKERVALAPAQGARVVYVIDEVHMLTNEAFNAFLKTLEEPPEHVVFVLCTTEIQKLPETIVSRCTKISLMKATPEEVVGSLKKAVEGEGLEVKEEVLKSIAKRVDGSFRDGMKILEQLAQENKTITQEMVDEYTGFSSEYEVGEMVTALMVRDAHQAMKLLGEKYSLGVDIGVLAKRLVEEARVGMLKRLVRGPAEVVGEWRALTERLARAAMEVKLAMVPEVPLEIAVVEWCLGAEGKLTTDDKQQTTDNKQEESTKSTTGTTSTKSKEKKADTGDFETDKKEGSAEILKTADGAEGKHTSVDLSLDVVREQWGEVLSRVRPFNHSLEALLKATRPTMMDGDWLTVEVFYTFHKEQLEQDKHRKIIEEVMAKVLGAQCKLQFVLGKRVEKAVKADRGGVKNVEASVADEKLMQAAEEIFS